MMKYNKPIAEILLVSVDMIRTSGVDPVPPTKEVGDNDHGWSWGGKGA